MDSSDFRPLTPGHSRLAWAALVVASMAGLAFYLHFRTAAFPEHAIVFRIDRTEAARRARVFARTNGMALDGYREVTVFLVADDTKTYLERRLGVAETARLAHAVDLWHFSTRFFRPLDQEEVRVDFTPDGKLVGYTRTIPPGRRGAHLSPDAALARAERIVSGQTALRAGDWTLVSTDTRPGHTRDDHSFVLERSGFRAGDAADRVWIDIHGDQLAGYREYLQIPEAWTRGYAHERATNDLAQQIANSVLYLVFGLSALAVFLLGYRDGHLRLRFAARIAAAVFAIDYIRHLNAAPLQLYSVPTTESWGAALAGILASACPPALFWGAGTLLAVAAGESLYRRRYPERLALEYAVSRGLGRPESIGAVVISVCVGILGLSYQVAYYLLGRWIGIWTPAAVNYSDLFSTAAPWIYPLSAGFVAAAFEEGTFRLFGIPFLERHLKSRPAAIVITAFAWGFLHSSYPQSPWFARGIEVGLMGVVFGLLFVRYGILASASAHYTFNATMSAIVACASNRASVIVPDTLVALLPLLLVGAALVRYGRRPDTGELPGADSPGGKLRLPLPEPMQGPAPEYRPMPRAAWLALPAVGVALAALAIGMYGRPRLPVPYSIGRADARRIASATPRSRGVSTADLRCSVTDYSYEDNATAEYLMQQAGPVELAQRYDPWVRSYGWKVRFFRPLQADEYMVLLRADGSVYAVDEYPGEATPGAHLCRKAALQVARQYLIREQRSLPGYLASDRLWKRARRDDYDIVFARSYPDTGPALFATVVTVQGDRVGQFSQYVNLPQEWLFRHRRASAFIVAGYVALLCLSVAAALMVIATLLDCFAAGIGRRRVVGISAGVGLLWVALMINHAPACLDSYSTAEPLAEFIARSLNGDILWGIALSIGTGVGLSVFRSLWARQVGTLPPDPDARHRYFRDALLAGYALALPLALVHLLPGGLDMLRAVAGSTDALHGPPLGMPSRLDTFLPVLGALVVPAETLGIALAIGLLTLVFQRYLKRWPGVYGVLCAAVFGTAVLLGYPPLGMASRSIVMNALLFVALLLLAGMIVYLVRSNLHGYMIALYSGSLLIQGGDLLA